MSMTDSKKDLLKMLRGAVGETRVISAMERVPREAFVSQNDHHRAYENVALHIEKGQTISQPLMIAIMINALDPQINDKVLEIGTGSGYQAAILGELAARVVTLERINALHISAKTRLAHLGYRNITIERSRDTLGLASEGPFNGIIVAAGAPKIPIELIDQLAPGGRLVLPIGSLTTQELIKVTKTAKGNNVSSLGACQFVPLIGKGAWPDTRI